ncbi:3-deoxy-manno-octulosonate cytidylyltransferase [bacterium]|nr:3-deoxy-manno-octulosonate cytidylyltransferase [bacterium]
MEKQNAIIIPARYASTRLEGKPLIEVDGKPIIQWVWEKAKQVKNADRVIIATDDERILNKALSFGAEAEMTDVNHKSGSDRIYEVVKRHPEFDIVVNLQGDEPMILPENVDLVIRLLKENQNADISTLVRELTDKNDIENPNNVKCVFDKSGYALYFSRSKIPYERNEGKSKFYGHLGIYGYRRESLKIMTELEQTSLEMAESLEQLRALQNGMKIITGLVQNSLIGIDTKEDLEAFKKAIK